MLTIRTFKVDCAETGVNPKVIKPGLISLGDKISM